MRSVCDPSLWDGYVKERKGQRVVRAREALRELAGRNENFYWNGLQG